MTRSQSGEEFEQIPQRSIRFTPDYSHSIVEPNRGQGASRGSKPFPPKLV